jgi:hypothetical protein
MTSVPALLIEPAEHLPALPAADLDRAANFARQDKSPATRAAYTRRQGVLASPTLRIVQELIHGGLPHVTVH